MTTKEWAGVAAKLSSYWPSLKLTRADVAMWFERLRAYSIEEVEAAVERALHRGSEWSPSLASLVQGVELARQGPPPTWSGAHRTIAQHITMLSYHEPMTTWTAFVAAVSEEHEAVGRFVVALGSADRVRSMPDPAFVQDTSGSVSLTELEREYRETTNEWKSNPTAGLALREARRFTQLRRPGAMADAVAGLRPVRQIASPSDWPANVSEPTEGTS